MGSHPLNLGVRFLLEVVALIGSGMWGWQQTESWTRYPLAIGIPLMLAVIWVVFAVPDDPSRSGKAPIVTSGIIRLVLELGIFAFATWAFYDIGFHRTAIGLAIITTLHYCLSYDRIGWLFTR